MTSRCFNGINLFAFTTLPWIRLISRIYSEYLPDWDKNVKICSSKDLPLLVGDWAAGRPL